MLSIPGTEALSPAVKYIIAFTALFVLLGLLMLVLRRVTGRRLSLPGQERGRSRQPRLGIVDVYDLDRQRQLILLRRDSVEHLLLIGGPNDVIVETNIVRTPGARLPAGEPALDRPDPLMERVLEGPARPLIEPVPRPEAVVARLGATEAARPGTDGPARTEPAQLSPEPILKPDVVALAPTRAEPARAAPQLLREPPPPAPRPAPQQRAAPAKPAPTEAPPPMRPAPEPPIRQPAPAPARPKDATIADAAVLSDMAKHLEEALKRPLSPGRPASAAPPPNGPAPHAEERASRASATPPGREPASPPHAPPAPPAAKATPEPPPATRPKPAPVTRIRPAPEPEPAHASAPAESPEPARTPAPSPEQVDPFSVEEIEAEFARLLGRPLDRNDRPH